MNHLIIDTETTGVTTNYSKPTKNNPDGLTMKPGEEYPFKAGHSQPYMLGMALYDESWKLVEERKFTFAPSSARAVLEFNGIEPTEEAIRDTIDANEDLYRSLHLIDRENNIHMENIDNPQPFELGAAEVSGADEKEVDALGSYADSGAAEALRELSKNADVIAYNADFDVKMLCYEAKLNHDDMTDIFFDADGHKKYIDAMEYAKDKIGIDKNLRLEELVQSIRKEAYLRNPEGGRDWYTQSHDALADVKDTAECLKALDEGIVPSKDNVIRALKEMRKSRREKNDERREKAKDLTGEDKIMELYFANEEDNSLRYSLDDKIDHLSGKDPVLVKTEIDDPGKGKRELSFIEVFGLKGDGDSFRYDSKAKTMIPDSFGHDDKPKSLSEVIARAADIKGIQYGAAKDGYMRLMKNTLAAPFRYARKNDKLLKPVWKASSLTTPEAVRAAEEFSKNEWGQKMPNTYIKAASEATYGKKPSSLALDMAKEAIDERAALAEKVEKAFEELSENISIDDNLKGKIVQKVYQEAEAGADAKLAMNDALKEVEGYEPLPEKSAKGLEDAMSRLNEPGKSAELQHALDIGMKPENAAAYIKFGEEKEEAVKENTAKEIDPSWSEYDQSVAKAQMENFGEIKLDEYGKPRDDIEDMAYEEEETAEESHDDTHDEHDEEAHEEHDEENHDENSKIIFTAGMLIDNPDNSYFCVADEKEENAKLIRMSDTKCVAQSNAKDGLIPIYDYLKEHGIEKMAFDYDSYKKDAMENGLESEVKAGDWKHLKEEAESELVRIYGSLEEANEWDGKEFVQACIDNGYALDYTTYSEMEEIIDAVESSGCRPLNNVELYQALSDVHDVYDDRSTHDLEVRDIVSAIHGLETMDGKPFVLDSKLTPEEIEESAKNELKAQFGSLKEAEKYGEMGYVDACKELGRVVGFSDYQHMEEVRDAIKEMDCKPADAKTLYEAVDSCLFRYGMGPGQMTAEPEKIVSVIPELEMNDGTPAHGEIEDISKASRERLLIYMADHDMDRDMSVESAVEAYFHPDMAFHPEKYPLDEIREAGSFQNYVMNGKVDEFEARTAASLDAAKERLDMLEERNQEKSATVEMKLEVVRDGMESYFTVSKGDIAESCAISNSEQDILAGNTESVEYNPVMELPSEDAGKVEIPRNLYERLDAGDAREKLDALKNDFRSRMEKIEAKTEKGDMPSASSLKACAKIRSRMEPYENRIADSMKAREELIEAAKPAMLEYEKGCLKEQTLAAIANLQKSMDRCKDILSKLDGGEKNAAKEKSAKDPELV